LFSFPNCQKLVKEVGTPYWGHDIEETPPYAVIHVGIPYNTFFGFTTTGEGHHAAGLISTVTSSHISTVVTKGLVWQAPSAWHRSASWFVRIKKVMLEEDWLDFKYTISHACVKSRAVIIPENLASDREIVMFFLFFSLF
jgi:hypothetical protein